MTTLLQLFLRIIASRLIGPPPAGRQIEAGEAEQDREVAAVEQRQEHRLRGLEHVSDEIGERHFAGQDEGARAA